LKAPRRPTDRALPLLRRVRSWTHAAVARLRRVVTQLLGPPLRSPLAAGPEAVFLVVPGPVTTLVPLAGPLTERQALTAPLPRLARGEFQSRAERERLLSLPPLDAQAAATIDWDSLVRDLDRGA